MAKSIIDVDVRDAAFAKFQAAFAKYQAALKAMPADWVKVGAASTEASKKFTAATDELEKQQEAFERIAKAEALINKHAGDSERTFRGVARQAKDIAASVGNITWNLAKWATLGGLFGLGTSVGGLFGMGGLASSASNLRRTSQGLGVSPGQLRSAEVNYQKYFDAHSVLGGIENAQADLSKRWVFGALGVSPGDVQNKNAAELLPGLLPKLIGQFKGLGSTAQALDASGAGTLGFDLQTMIRLSKISPSELASTAASYQKDRSNLGVTDATLQRWQALDAQLDRAKDKLENVLLVGLEKLSGPLANLSDSFTKAVDTFMKSDKVGQWIEQFGVGMEKAAKYIASDEFETDIHRFVDGIAKLANGIEAVLRFLGLMNTPKNGPAVDPGGMAAHGGRFGGGTHAAPTDPITDAWHRLTANGNRGRFGGGSSDAASIAALEQQYGLPSGMLWGVYGAESNYGKGGMLSPKGAKGPFQFMDPTAAQYHLKNPYDFKESSDAAARFFRDLMNYYGGDKDKALSGYNYGQGNTDALIKQYGAGWQSHLPKETAQYILRVDNATGGNAVVSMRQLAH